MSGCWVVVPLKRLAHAKQRLSPVLSPDARATLAVAMLEDVLSVVRRAKGVEGIAIVTAEPHLVPPNILWIADPESGLNGAIALAAAEFERRGASAMLVIPADVPLVTTEEIERILSVGRSASIVIAGDRAQRGTNALFLSPPRTIAPQFGEDSLGKHLAAARAAQQQTQICNCPGLAFDIDQPSDLAELRERRRKR